MISKNTIQQILDRLDIVDVVGGFVKLKKRGANYLGLCPFHNEKTPSFTVSPTRELFKCFGCGRSGNAVSFVMEHEKYSYPEALRWLATRYGIEIEESFQTDEQRQQVQVADSLYIINQFAQEFFSRTLLETEEGRDIGLAYFRERGFREDIIRKFQLGFAPEVRDAFTREALSRQFNAELLSRAGLIVERNGDWQDTYRGRVIFPVHNQSGKVLGFGARILKNNDRAPKYINTPENEIYVKSRILYGSYFARLAIDKADECLLVEGYTDVISLHQAGIENVVASGGTALTPDQLRLVQKYSNNLTILYDGDTAGVKAALRGLDLAIEEGLNVRLVLLPDGHDPDSFVNKEGAAALRDFIQRNKKDFILFQLDVALQDAGNDPVRKAAVVNRIAETISRMNKAEDFTRRQDYIRQCAQLLKIDEAGMHALVNRFIRDRITAQERKAIATDEREAAVKSEAGAAADYDDSTYLLLFKDELQEKEVARILLEYGQTVWDESRSVADYIFEELGDESLIDNQDVIRLIRHYRDTYREQRDEAASGWFVYHSDPQLSAFAVSLLNMPYEQSDHWRREFSQSTGYQPQLFGLDYEAFMKTIARENADTLMGYLKAEEQRSNEAVASALRYLKLRKIKRMLLENQQDMEKEKDPEEFRTLHQTHEHLKKMEVALTRSNGTVILR